MLDRSDRETPKGGTATAAGTKERSERVLRCRACEAEVAREDDRIEMSGAHVHTFVNPHGHVFEIGCFARAHGCAPVGRASAFFSWFPGYAWRIAVCGSCRAHLGWAFGEEPGFYGLILARLV
jgi:hypothetical protein